MGALSTHFWAPGGPGKHLGVSETEILEEFNFWLQIALKWIKVDKSMKCYTISESYWHVELIFIRFKLDFCTVWVPEASEGQKSENQLPSQDLEYLKKRPFFWSFLCLG